MGGDGWMWGAGWGGWVAMSLVILFWAAVISAVVVAIRYVSTPRSVQDAESTPALNAEEILAGRFARGEIDEDDYRHRLAVLLERHTTTQGSNS